MIRTATNQLLRIIGIFMLFTCLYITIPTAQAQLNLNQLSHLPFDDAELNDIWGWVAPDSTEYAIVGKSNGIAFIDLSNPAFPIVRATIPGGSSIWRDIKTWGNYAYIVDDQAGEGLIIADMSNLPNEVTYTTWNGAGSVSFNTCHNLFIDEKGRCFLFGCDYSTGGAIILDITTDPQNPQIIGNYHERYIHDGYVRNDTMYSSEINDGVTSIVNVADPINYEILATFSTPNNFSHNCWLSDDGNFLFTTDEVDDSYVAAYDISNIYDVKQADRIQSKPGDNVVPHNVFTVGDFLITSYYTSGVVIHDATNPYNLIEVGYFDTNPLNGGGTVGCWGVYPYLPSGIVIASDIDEGFYVLQPNYIRGAYLEGNITDAQTGAPIYEAKISVEEAGVSYTTDIEGNYLGGVSSANLYTIKVEKAGYQTQYQSDVFLISGVSTNLDIALEPLPSFTLSGTITDDNGNPIPNAEINITNDQFKYQLNTDTNGNYQISPFYEGDYDIIVGKWGYYTQALSNLNIPLGASAPNFNLQAGYYDDFTFDFGWSTSNHEVGQWERAVPHGYGFGNFATTPFNDITTDYGNQCYLTGEDQLYDFILGETSTLTSPTFDLSQHQQPWLHFALWLVNISANGLGNDSAKVVITNGITQATLAQYNATYPNGWQYESYYLPDFITPTANMQLIISGTSDYQTNQILEMGFDGFSIVDSSNVVGIPNIPQAAKSAFYAYPNPVHDQLILQINASAQAQLPAKLQVKMYNNLGQLVHTQNIATSQLQHQVSTDKLPAGMYYYQLINSQTAKQYHSGKIVKQ